MIDQRKQKSNDGSQPLEINLKNFVFNKSDFEDFLETFNKSFTKSGMFNLMNFYKGPNGFSPASIRKILSPNEDLMNLNWEFDLNKNQLKIKKSVLKKIASIISKECKFVGWLNQNYLNRLFNTDSDEIDKIFSKGSTLLAKLIFFFNSRHKQNIEEELIILLIDRIKRFSSNDLKVSNLFCYVKPKNVTFSNINQKNKLLKFNMKNLNMLTIGLNKNKKAKYSSKFSFNNVEMKPNGKKIFLIIFLKRLIF